MAQVRFLNRNRPNWLWAFSFVVVLLPLILGQSSAGGCGATVTVPSPNPNPGPNGNLDETIVVDSDRDGFSDDEEINSTPGTDPNDSTDNPNSVRDTDTDGCSDFDELNFPNFCDNDPYTIECQTTYYNTDFRFGFDLPPNAELFDTTDNEGFIIFGRAWLFAFEGSPMSVGTDVLAAPPQALAEFVDDRNRIKESMGQVIVAEFAFRLADGTEAYFTSSTGPVKAAEYTVDTFANGNWYSLRATFSDDAVPESADAYMIAILDSLCID